MRKDKIVHVLPSPTFVGVGKTIEVGAILMLPSEQEQMPLVRRLS